MPSLGLDSGILQALKRAGMTPKEQAHSVLQADADGVQLSNVCMEKDDTHTSPQTYERLVTVLRFNLHSALFANRELEESSDCQ